MSNALHGASFLMDGILDNESKAAFIRMFWRREPGSPAPLDMIPGAIKEAHKRANWQELTLSAQPTLSVVNDVILRPGKGIQMLKPGELGDYFMIYLEFDIIGRKDG